MAHSNHARSRDKTSNHSKQDPWAAGMRNRAASSAEAHKPGVAVRMAAARCIAAVEAQGQSLSERLPEAEIDVDARDRALLRELVYGTLRYQPRLAFWRNGLLKKPMNPRDSDVAALLICGLYQLTYLRTPPHAAISATVDAARGLGKPWAAGLVNGCLRNFQRRYDSLQAAAEKNASARSLHPQWWVERLSGDWPNAAMAIMEANNINGPMTLRVNQRQHSRQEYQQLLNEAGIESVAGQLSDAALILATPVDVRELPGFEAGAVSVQDEAAQLATELLGVKAGERVLDACAAPGGKTAHILESTDCEMLALDVDEKRLQRIVDNCQRLQLKAEVRCADIRDQDSWWDRQLFDKILLDAPCSAAGVVRRHPDIKLLRRDKDIEQLAELQWQCLAALWPTLKPGGLLLYATCSVFRAENEKTLERALRSFADLQIEPCQVDGAIPAGGGVQLLPGEAGLGTDGFYYAKLRKNSAT